MKTIYATFLLFLGVVSCGAQLPQARPWESMLTPAQTDWVIWMNGADLISANQMSANRPAGESVSIARLRHKPSLPAFPV